MAELRKIPGDTRDWRRWIKAVPMLRSIKDGERRRRLL